MSPLAPRCSISANIPPILWYSNSFTIDSFLLHIQHQLRVTSYDSWPFRGEVFRITMCSGSFSSWNEAIIPLSRSFSSHVFRTPVTYVATPTIVTRDDYVSIGFTWYFFVPRIKSSLERSVVNVLRAFPGKYAMRKKKYNNYVFFSKLASACAARRHDTD